MKAIVHDRYGPSAVLETRDVDVPKIGDGDVLVRVRAVGVNPADWAMMGGLPYVARPVYGLRSPRNGIRGTDVAGQVEAVGVRVTRFRPGDEVFGWCSGALAEFASVPENTLEAKPAGVTFEQAAAVPMAAMVALQALRDHGKVRAGQHVLVNGAAGGIGTFAVQLAKAFGAQVTGVASTANLDLLRSIGADHAIDYTREDFTRTGQRYDVILDNVGNRSLSDLRRALAPAGTLVPNGGRFDNRWFAGAGRVLAARSVSPFVRQTLRPFLLSAKHADLVVLRELIEAGTVVPVIGRTFPLREAAQAIDHVGAGHARGKVAIVVSGPGAGDREAVGAGSDPLAVSAG